MNAYPVLGLAGEIGEVSGAWAQARSAGTHTDADVQANLVKEVGDVLWYVANTAHEAGYTLQEIGELCGVADLDDLASQQEMDPFAMDQTLLQLSAEAGKVAERTKKALRDTHGVLTHANRAIVAEALGGILIHLGVLASMLGSSVSAVAQANLDKLASRAERGVLGGSGDNR